MTALLPRLISVPRLCHCADHAFVSLTRGYLTMVLPEDIGIIADGPWCAAPDRSTIYAVTKDKDKKTIRLHRLIVNASPGIEVDHRDRNGLNNRRSNLREATRAQNQMNAVGKPYGTSRFKGVDWDKKSMKWRARIKKAGKQKTLGYFTSEEAAHAAYCSVVEELHGKFARTES